MNNGKGTFYSLKRELTFGHIAGSVRSVGELRALRELICEQWDAIYQETNSQHAALYAIGAGLRAVGLDEDHTAVLAVHALRQHTGKMLDALREVYARDIALIDAFIEERQL